MKTKHSNIKEWDDDKKMIRRYKDGDNVDALMMITPENNCFWTPLSDDAVHRYDSFLVKGLDAAEGIVCNGRMITLQASQVSDDIYAHLISSLVLRVLCNGRPLDGVFVERFRRGAWLDVYVICNIAGCKFMREFWQ